jgi:erythromycin esterase-like protein
MSRRRPRLADPPDDLAPVTGALAAAARPLAGQPSDHDALLDLVGDRRLVLLGEGSHGTHEFYALRAEITRRLVEERGFDAVAVEGDWPDSERVHRWARGAAGDGAAGDGSAADALGGFRRFPQWMWRNRVVEGLVEFLRAHNAAGPGRDRPVGFRGLDLYSLHASIEEVVRYLDEVDPEAAGRARARYGCFEEFGDDPQAYGYAAGPGGGGESCEDAVVQQLVELRRREPELVRRAADGPGDGDLGAAADDYFSAEMNARLVLNAERYYRAMFRGRHASWNLRDTHMADTLDALVAHLRGQGRAGKVVVWAHNSHLGDARATELGAAGELNLGQLARERHGDDAVLVGFTTHDGHVTAAHDWGEPAERMRVNPSLPGSIERAMHDAALGAPHLAGAAGCFVPLRGGAAADRAREALDEPLLERAIGVIYRPRTERQSHYFLARVGRQFDALYHVDRTRAVVPLEDDAAWAGDAAEPPETYPSAL